MKKIIYKSPMPITLIRYMLDGGKTSLGFGSMMGDVGNWGLKALIGSDVNDFKRDFEDGVQWRDVGNILSRFFLDANMDELKNKKWWQLAGSALLNTASLIPGMQALRGAKALKAAPALLKAAPRAVLILKAAPLKTSLKIAKKAVTTPLAAATPFFTAGFYRGIGDTILGNDSSNEGRLINHDAKKVTNDELELFKQYFPGLVDMEEDELKKAIADIKRNPSKYGLASDNELASNDEYAYQQQQDVDENFNPDEYIIFS